MNPGTRDLRAGRDSGQSAGCFASSTAYDCRGRNVLDRVVVGRCTDANQLTLVRTVHLDLLHDGVGRGRGGQRQSWESESSLHADNACLRISENGVEKGRMKALVVA